MHKIRRHILEILKEGGGITVAELANQLDMAAVSVRHHLDILQGDNLIYVDRVKRKGCVGRPQQIYMLTSEATTHFPNNFALLAEGLVRQMKRAMPSEQISAAFKTIARELAGEIERKATGEAKEDIPAQLDHITESLTERGYLARWEPVHRGPSSHEKRSSLLVELSEQADVPSQATSIEGYLLHKYNCPYAGVSSEHSELCMMDQVLVNELMGQPCERIQSMVNGERCCTYRIDFVDESTCSDKAIPNIVLSDTIRS